MNTEDLLARTEGPALDFKERWPACKATLLHDLLCLANARVDGDRLLVFGVTDEAHQVVDLDQDLHRMTSHDFQDWLRNVPLNRSLLCLLESRSIAAESVVDIIQITDSRHKPFYLLKKYSPKDSRKSLAPGAVYVRNGDTNTPASETAPDDVVEALWRERFGLGLSALERMMRYVDDHAAWEKHHGESGLLYCKEAPEFTIVEGATLNENFREAWAEAYPDPSAWSLSIELRFHATVLRRLSFVDVDGGRYRVPMPEPVLNGRKAVTTWETSESSLASRVAELLYHHRLSMRPPYSPGHMVRLVP